MITRVITLILLLIMTTIVLAKGLEDEKAYIMEPIVVKGEKARDLIGEPLTESSGLELSTSLINEGEIERQGANTIVEALEYVPGVWVETRGRKVKQFLSVRGQKYPYTEYAIDGAWQREFHEMPYFFSASNIQRIEVIRSSAALLKGLSGLVGIINIIPKKYDKPETSTEMEYGTFDSYRFHLSHGDRVGKVSYAFDLGSNHTQGPENRNAEEGMTNFLGNFNWQPLKTISINAHLFHLYGKRELIRALPPAAESYQKTSERFDPLEATMGVVKTHFRPVDKASTEFILHYVDRDSRFYSDPGDPHKTTRDWDYELGLNLTQAISLSNNNVVRFGGLYNHWVAPNGKRFYEGKRNDLVTYSAVIVDEHRFGPLTLDGGIRWVKDHINDYASFNIEESMKGLGNITPIKDQWQPSVFNGSVGASYYPLLRVSLHLNLASGYIKPNPGALDVELKDPKNEKRIKIDLGIRGIHEKIGLVSLVGFFTQQKDAIVLSGRTKKTNDRVLELYLNQDQDQLGLEIEFRTVPLLGFIEPFFNGVAFKSRADSNGEMVEDKDQPKLIMSGGLYASKSNLDLNILWKYISSYESVRFAAGNPPSPQPLGDFHVLKATIGYSLGSNHRARIYMEVENLMDSEFSTVVGYPDLGRRFTLGLRQSFL